MDPTPFHTVNIDSFPTLSLFSQSSLFLLNVSFSLFFSKVSIIQFSLWPLSDGAAVCRDLVALVLCCCQSSVQLQHPFRVCLKAYQLGNPILRPDQSRQQLHKAPKFFFFFSTLTLLCSLMSSAQVLHWTARMMKFKTPRTAHKTAVSYC